MSQITNEVLDMAVVTGSCGVTAGRSGNDTMWTARVDIIGWKNLQSRFVTREKKKVLWQINYSDISQYRELIAPYSIVRLSLIDAGDHFVLNKVITNQYADPDLAGILAEELKPVYYDDSVLGRFPLDKTIDTFGKSIVWAGEKGKLHFDNSPDEESILSSLKTAHHLFEKEHIWSKEAKAFAAKELLDLANDWLTDNENVSSSEITPELFINRISLECINVKSNGNFEIYFADGDLFWGHVIIVEGNINSSFSSAEIAG